MSFSAGAVCDGLDPASTAAVNMLRGKTLVVAEMPWEPYARFDEATGWSGFDVDLIDTVAHILGFNYTLYDMGSPLEGETYNDLLLRTAQMSDFVASFWGTDYPERSNTLNMVRGHVDLSVVLMSAPKTQNDDVWHALFSFAGPFEPSLWFLLIAILLTSGVIDYLVERRDRRENASLTKSLFEYGAGFLWGGFEAPMTRTSAVYQLLIGFIFLVVVSSYTANLAAFILSNSVTSQRVSSVLDAMLHSKAVCCYDGIIPTRVRQIFPTISFSGITTKQYDLANSLTRNATCDGVISSMASYELWRTKPEYCEVAIVETLYSSSGGWATNRQSWCVQASLSYALDVLTQNGTLSNMRREYWPQAACKSSSAPSGGVRSMRPLDFLGVFVLWAAISVPAIAYGVWRHVMAKSEVALKRLQTMGSAAMGSAAQVAVMPMANPGGRGDRDAGAGA